jgi:hypothetical protein
MGALVKELGDKCNVVFAGCTVVRSRGRGCIQYCIQYPPKKSLLLGGIQNKLCRDDFAMTP